MKRSILICFGFVVTVVLSGCSTTIPAGATGVLSSIQQKTLNLATKRAMDVAGVESNFIGDNLYYIELSEIGEADIGKQHVSGAVRSEISQRGAKVTSNRDTADCILLCTIHVAGIDTRPGSFWPLFRWIDTNAEVDFSIEKQCKSETITKHGVEYAKFNQVWFLGIGPSESIK